MGWYKQAISDSQAFDRVEEILRANAIMDPGAGPRHKTGHRGIETWELPMGTHISLDELLSLDDVAEGGDLRAWQEQDGQDEMVERTKAYVENAFSGFSPKYQYSEFYDVWSHAVQGIGVPSESELKSTSVTDIEASLDALGTLNFIFRWHVEQYGRYS